MKIQSKKRKALKRVWIWLFVLSMVLMRPMSVFATENVSWEMEQGEQNEVPDDSWEISEEGGLSDQSGYQENSFRYEDGAVMDTDSTMRKSRARSAVQNVAWQKIDGVCYNNRGEVVEGATLKAIDVSEHNKKIDWEQVKESDVDFAILRVGYGNNLKSQDDKWWKYNADECTRLGIPFGVYIYSYAKNIREAESEADHVLRLIEGYHLDYPIYYDLEDNSIVSIGSVGLKNNAIAFCNKIEAAGYDVGIYSGLYFTNTYLTDEIYNNWHKWMAQYNYQCDYKGAYEMWQCTSDGTVPGIEGRVDINFYYQKQQLEKKRVSSVSYRGHVENIGWQQYQENGAVSGTTNQGLRIEAMEFVLNSTEYSGGISYRAHVQNIGWQSYQDRGLTAGTSGKSLRVEALQIYLTGDIANYYDIYYRVHAQNFGWLDWAKNNEVAGTVGYSYRLEAVQVMLVRKGDAAPGSTGNPSRTKEQRISYSTHVQNIGWQNSVYDGATAGTTGKSLRLECLKLSLCEPLYSGSIVYSTHIQNFGWQQSVSDGQLSGTTGRSLRLEAVSIQLTGEIANYYDIYYRVHIESRGWLDWTKNGNPAGSEGCSYRMEAIEIKMLPKNDMSIQVGNNAFISGL